MKESVEGKVLGKQVAYPKTYSPDILVAIPRLENRERYNIDENQLPFAGFDAWHAYEVGFLTKLGLPIAGVLKIVYPSNNTFIVESKSLKLYLNSFNHEKMGSTKKEAINNFATQVKDDLCKLLNTTVNIAFFETSDNSVFDFDGYTKLEDEGFAQNTRFIHKKENPALLQFSETGDTTQNVYSNLLRSNCKITNQPDWGSIYIHIKTEHPIRLSSMLEYIVSFRDENHFHEEVCEMIYVRLWNFYKPVELAITCLYTRRGGIDICPSRASSIDLLPKHLSSANTVTNKTLRQ